jgi:hypothetical protein
LLNLGGRGRVDVLHQDDGGIRLLENLQPSSAEAASATSNEVIQIPRAGRRTPSYCSIMAIVVPAGHVSGAPPCGNRRRSDLADVDGFLWITDASLWRRSGYLDRV